MKNNDELEAVAAISQKLEAFGNYAYPKNQRLKRQFIGIYLWGFGYLDFILARLGFLYKKSIRIKLFWGKEIVLPFNRVTAEMAYLGCIPEPTLISYILKHISGNDVFYDIGASYGFYSWLIGGKAKEIDSFEPNREVFPYIGKFSESSSIILNNVLVSDMEKDAKYFKGKLSTSNTANEDAAAAGSKIEMIKAITLDEYSKNHSAPTMMKFDIEGGEYKALMGAKKILSSQSPTIIMEVWGGSGDSLFLSQP